MMPLGQHWGERLIQPDALGAAATEKIDEREDAREEIVCCLMLHCHPWFHAISVK